MRTIQISSDFVSLEAAEGCRIKRKDREIAAENLHNCAAISVAEIDNWEEIPESMFNLVEEDSFRTEMLKEL